MLAFNIFVILSHHLCKFSWCLLADNFNIFVTPSYHLCKFSTLIFVVGFHSLQEDASKITQESFCQLILQNLDWDPNKTRLYYCIIEKRGDNIATIFKVCSFLFSSTNVSLSLWWSFILPCISYFFLWPVCSFFLFPFLLLCMAHLNMVIHRNSFPQLQDPTCVRASTILYRFLH